MFVMTRNTDDKKYCCCFGSYFGNKKDTIEQSSSCYFLQSFASFSFPISLLCCNKKMSEFVNDIAVCDLQKIKNKEKKISIG